MYHKKWIVNKKQRCDLEMLLTGGFYPLTGFLSQADYHHVLLQGRLSNGALWPIPITLDVTAEFAAQIMMTEIILLCDHDHRVLARMRVTDRWQPDLLFEAKQILGTNDLSHPGVHYLLHQANTWYLGGAVELVCLPPHHDFQTLRHTPRELKQYFYEQRCERVVGFQTRNPMHRAHYALTLHAAASVDAHILLHPTVGMTKPDDIHYATRVRCYEKILTHYSSNAATLSLLPLAMRMAGPKEALWHALIRKNYGCTHFIVGRDHAGVRDADGKRFYLPDAAQQLAKLHEEEMQIKIIAADEIVYAKERQQYCFLQTMTSQETALTISGSQLRHALKMNQVVPTWFSFPEIIDELQSSFFNKKGLTIFLTGLSGAGKTTLANALHKQLPYFDSRKITLLDGDVVRQSYDVQRSFTKADRNWHVRSLGKMAAEITQSGGIAVCAAIAPYADTRNENRRIISHYGRYIEIYVSTSLSVCEQRDPKKLYARVRRGEIKNFTGVDDPYEAPISPDMIIDTEKQSIEQSVATVIHFLYVTDALQENQATLIC